MRLPVEIIGGGLAGLSLGLALRRQGVGVTVHEAGDYPRPRVCGEFITGLVPATIERLGLAEILAGARPHREVAWFRGERELLRHALPTTAWAISRFDLDARLAEAFQRAGGHLVTRSRVDPAPRPGRINATGRRRSAAPWVGLKLHVRGLKLTCGLELHLGRQGYVGLCGLPGGEVNVCGLFQRQEAPGDRASVLLAYLRGAGLDALAERVGRAERCAGSEAAVAGVDFGRVPEAPGEISLGDAHCLLPPFFGNGMAAAFQMAEQAAGPLEAWSRGGATWEGTCATVRAALRRRFRLRATVGGALHSLVLSPTRQRWLGGLARTGLLPTRLLYTTLH
jgi:flavin-dependent dehydrogenase